MGSWAEYMKNNESGFAIGLILLAVVLIAAIVSGIAISTTSSANSAQIEEDMLTAQAKRIGILKVSQALSRFEATGGSLSGITIGVLTSASILPSSGYSDITIASATLNQNLDPVSPPGMAVDSIVVLDSAPEINERLCSALNREFSGNGTIFEVGIASIGELSGGELGTLMNKNGYASPSVGSGGCGLMTGSGQYFFYYLHDIAAA